MIVAVESYGQNKPLKFYEKGRVDEKGIMAVMQIFLGHHK